MQSSIWNSFALVGLLPCIYVNLEFINVHFNHSKSAFQRYSTRKLKSAEMRSSQRVRFAPHKSTGDCASDSEMVNSRREAVILTEQTGAWASWHTTQETNCDHKAAWVPATGFWHSVFRFSARLEDIGKRRRSLGILWVLEQPGWPVFGTQ